MKGADWEGLDGKRDYGGKTLRGVSGWERGSENVGHQGGEADGRKQICQCVQRVASSMTGNTVCG